MPTTVRNYEAMIVIKSILPEETITGIIDKLSAILTNGGAELREISKWGRRRLAYDIDKQSEGYYAIFYFTTDTVGNTVLEAFERACRFDENVLRQMTVLVPLKKRGNDIKQIVPTPGWLSEYRFEPRPQMPRRPRMPRSGDMDQQQGPPPSAPESAPAPAEAEVAPQA